MSTGTSVAHFSLSSHMHPPSRPARKRRMHSTTSSVLPCQPPHRTTNSSSLVTSTLSLDLTTHCTRVLLADMAPERLSTTTRSACCPFARRTVWLPSVLGSGGRLFGDGLGSQMMAELEKSWTTSSRTPGPWSDHTGCTGVWKHRPTLTTDWLSLWSHSPLSTVPSPRSPLSLTCSD